MAAPPEVLNRIAQRFRQVAGGGQPSAAGSEATALLDKLNTPDLVAANLTFPQTDSYIHRALAGDLVFGAPPPSPLTLRGRVGLLLIGATFRLLRWLIARGRAEQHAHAEVLAEHTRHLGSLATELDSSRDVLKAAVTLIHQLTNNQANLSSQLTSLSSELSSLRSHVSVMERRAQRSEDRVRELQDEMETLMSSYERYP